MRVRTSLVSVLAFAASAAVVASASAGKIQVNTDPSGVNAYLNGTDGSGGAFIVTGLQEYNGEYGGPGGSATTFATFCVERNEYLSNGGVYYTKIDIAADKGGTGGPSPDPLSSASALLYSTFRSGGSIPVAGIGVIDTPDEVSGLQYAIWKLEDETSGGFPVAAANTFADAMVTWATNNAVDGNLYNVRVLQLWTNPNLTGNQQDLLTIVPTPTASLAGMSLLGGLGLVGVMRKRRNSGDLL